MALKLTNWQAWLTPSISLFRRQRQCDLEASFVYLASQGYIVRSCLRKKKKKGRINELMKETKSTNKAWMGDC